MAVDVAIDQYLSILLVLNLRHKSFGVVDLGVELLARQNPLPIEIDTGQTTPVISTDDSIWIHAWDHPEDEVA